MSDLREAFEIALRCEPADRAAFVRNRFGSDTSKADEVLALLRCHESDSAFLQHAALGPSFSIADALNSDVGRLPATFDGFTIEHRIGIGGMGVVYSAWQTDPRRRVAIKILRDELASPASLDRFHREVRALARLQHPSIAPIFAAGTIATPIGHKPYFAMRLVNGEPLAEYATRRALDARSRINLFLQLTSAVEHAHQQGVIHRDIKTANVLVENTELGARICILDFGVAKLVDELPGPVTEAGGPVGTLNYMSPEQINGRRDIVDTRSDIYSLGVVLFELLTGHMPFAPATTYSDAVRRVASVAPLPLSRYDRNLRGGIESVVSRCLEKDKSRRYDSVGALADDLHRYLNNEPTRAQRPNVLTNMRMFARRNIAGVLFTSAALTGVVVLLIALAISVRGLRFAYRDLDARYASSLDRVRQSVRTAVDELGPLLGSQQAQRRILEQAAATLSELLSERADDRAARALRSEVQLRLSVLELDSGHTTLAMRMRETELPNNRLFLAENPSSTLAARQLALNLVLIGDIHNVLGDSATAEPYFEEAMLHFRRNLWAKPDDPRVLSEFAWSCYRLAGLWRNGPLRSGVLELNREGDDAAARLDAIAPNESTALALRWHLNWQKRGLYRMAGIAADEDAITQEAIQIADELLTRFANDRLALECVLETSFSRAEQAMLDGDPHRAAEFRRETTLIARDLVTAAPHSEQVILTYHACIAAEARGLIALHQPEAAITLLEHPVNRAARRVAADPRAPVHFAAYATLAAPLISALLLADQHDVYVHELNRLCELMPPAEVFSDIPPGFAHQPISLFVSDEAAPLRTQVDLAEWCIDVIESLRRRGPLPQWMEELHDAALKLRG